MPLWAIVFLVLGTILLGALLIGWIASRLPRNRKAFAVASAMFLPFGVFNANQERIAEVREEDENSKRQKADDPPEP